MDYDILLFDADATLFDFDKAEKIAFFEIAAQNGVIPTDSNFEIYRKFNLKNWEDLENGLVSKERLLVRRFEQFYAALNIQSGDPVKFNREYLSALSTKNILFDYALTLVKNLKNAGMRIFLITNGVTSVQDGRISASPIKDYLDGVFISEQLGVCKPEKLFFDLIAKRIENYDKKRTIVIGDSLTSDIRGAINAGLDSIWLNLKNAPYPKNMNITFEAKSLKEVEKILLSGRKIQKQ